MLLELATFIDEVYAGRYASPPLIFLSGEGGTGKSYVYEVLELMLEAAGRTLAPSALTGVACTAIHTHASVRTTASLYQLNLSPYLIKLLTDLQLRRFRDTIGEPLVLVVDECSFAEPCVYAALSEYVLHAQFKFPCDSLNPF